MFSDKESRFNKRPPFKNMFVQNDENSVHQDREVRRNDRRSTNQETGNRNDRRFGQGSSGGNQRPYQNDRRSGDRNWEQRRDRSDHQSGRQRPFYRDERRRDPQDRDQRGRVDAGGEGEESYLDQPAIKQQLLSYVYNMVEISKYKYKILEYEHDLAFLKDNSYFVSPNYNGITGLMVFTRIRDRFFSFIVDRRTLSYNLNQLDLEKVKMIPFNIRLNKQIYEGTILDGVLLYNHKNNRSKTFVVNDVYYFCGQNLLEDYMNNKITNVSTFMDTCYVDDPQLNSISFVVNKLYNLHEIKELVNSYIPKSKFSNSIKGLTFHPKLSGTKLIYLYNNCSNSKVGEASPQAVQLVNAIDVRESKIEVKDSFTATFRMKKKDTVDVYQLYLCKKVSKNGKKFMKFEKFDMAYVPTKDCSYFCKDLFDKIGTDTVLVECKYLPDRNKWIPVEESVKKRPDDIEKIREKLGITDSKDGSDSE